MQNSTVHSIVPHLLVLTFVFEPPFWTLVGNNYLRGIEMGRYNDFTVIGTIRYGTVCSFHSGDGGAISERRDKIHGTQE